VRHPIFHAIVVQSARHVIGADKRKLWHLFFLIPFQIAPM
jgi:hypothetical protein